MELLLFTLEAKTLPGKITLPALMPGTIMISPEKIYTALFINGSQQAIPMAYAPRTGMY